MNTIDKKYQDLLQDILDNGITKSDRTGTGTISVFGRQIRHKMSQGFPLLTTKKVAWKVMVTELLWFLRGDTNIKFLLDYDCHIWTGDAYKRYVEEHKKEWADKMTPEQLEKSYPDIKEFENLIKTVPEFAEKWGELGPIYGAQWRSWNGIDREFWINTDNIDDPLVGGHGLFYQPSKIDQIANLISELKTNPDSRRLMVNAWNVGELDQMVLPPCHYGFQVYTRELSKDERMDYWFTNNKPNRDVCDSVDESTEIEQHKHFDEAYVPKRAISLIWNQRSCDTFLGLPFNIASYGLLLEIIAKEVNMVPDELIGNLGDVHLYKNHIEQTKEQISRESFDLPKVQITERNWYQHELVKERLGPKSFNDKILSYRPDCFELMGYQSHPSIKAPLSN